MMNDDPRRYSCTVGLTKVEAEALSRLLQCQVIMKIDGHSVPVDFRFDRAPAWIPDERHYALRLQYLPA